MPDEKYEDEREGGYVSEREPDVLTPELQEFRDSMKEVIPDTSLGHEVLDAISNMSIEDAVRYLTTGPGAAVIPDASRLFDMAVNGSVRAVNWLTEHFGVPVDLITSVLQKATLENVGELISYYGPDLIKWILELDTRPDFARTQSALWSILSHFNPTFAETMVASLISLDSLRNIPGLAIDAVASIFDGDSAPVRQVIDASGVKWNVFQPGGNYVYAMSTEPWAYLEPVKVFKTKTSAPSNVVDNIVKKVPGIGTVYRNVTGYNQRRALAQLAEEDLRSTRQTYNFLHEAIKQLGNKAIDAAKVYNSKHSDSVGADSSLGLQTPPISPKPEIPLTPVSPPQEGEAVQDADKEGHPKEIMSQLLAKQLETTADNGNHADGSFKRYKVDDQVERNRKGR